MATCAAKTETMAAEWAKIVRGEKTWLFRHVLPPSRPSCHVHARGTVSRCDQRQVKRGFLRLRLRMA